MYCHLVSFLPACVAFSPPNKNLYLNMFFSFFLWLPTLVGKAEAQDGQANEYIHK